MADKAFWTKVLVGAAAAAVGYDVFSGGALRVLLQKFPLAPAIFTDDQKRMETLILREFSKAGIPVQIGYAAVVNAWAESRLDPDIKSGFEGEDSVGLFQLNSAPRAAGAGMSVKSRQNPATNTRVIIRALNAAKNSRESGLPSLVQAYNDGASVARLTELFTVYVERPRNRLDEGKMRAASAITLYPGLAVAGVFGTEERESWA